MAPPAHRVYIYRTGQIVEWRRLVYSVQAALQDQGIRHCVAIHVRQCQYNIIGQEMLCWMGPYQGLLWCPRRLHCRSSGSKEASGTHKQGEDQSDKTYIYYVDHQNSPDHVKNNIQHI